ncbi:MAG: hypothetical protein MRECE_28c027 [Mycoplasmataceae bacterium CE_OT135]|nr:MAG: hypothetical protein MRECE_28c027 [Mycoplasmataceae bacterium CE_OT135]
MPAIKITIDCFINSHFLSGLFYFLYFELLLWFLFFS